ncbi:hypothetical protein [Flexithrix dorotheae]|uniref:hypothetical protein n=1 Tax=Flexithrix dorotheae TaxID=70993 RepID=UPI00035CE9E6|nr:hypothetical protein [Flexithrix dorotheae]
MIFSYLISILYLINFSFSQDIKQEDLCTQIKSKGKQFSGDIITIKLSEMELFTQEFVPVDARILDAYIKEDSSFKINQNTTGELDYYHYGYIEQEDFCLLLVYEYFVASHSENKLFLLVFNKSEVLESVLKVAELTYKLDEKYEESSVFSNDYFKSEIIKKERIQDDGPSNNYKETTILNSYHIENFHFTELLSSDTTSIVVTN